MSVDYQIFDNPTEMINYVTFEIFYPTLLQNRRELCSSCQRAALYKCQGGNLKFKKKISNLEIEETLGISPRKTLHIVRAFDEKFLIASDTTSTTLLAKLNSDGVITPVANDAYDKDFSDLVRGEDDVTMSKESSVIKSMLKKLNN